MEHKIRVLSLSGKIWFGELQGVSILTAIALYTEYVIEYVKEGKFELDHTAKLYLDEVLAKHRMF